MNRRSVWLDPSFWILIAVNAYLVWYYYQHPGVFTTLVWIYWFQSVLLGFFNFLDMLTVQKISVRLNKDGQPSSDSFSSKRPAAFFFLVHYGFFHFVYFFFVISMKRSGPFDFALFKYFVLAFLIGQIVNFVQHKIQQRKQAVNLGTMFFTPYLRILPMHLTILAPTFLHISALGIFLILKAIADVVMYIVTRPSYKSRETDSALLASQQSSTLM